MTIKELSNELGVSEQALRQWCKKNNVRKESTNETKGKKASYFLDENTVEQIREYYSGKGKETKASTKGKESDPSFRFELDILKQTIETLQQQLEVKDNQISELTAALNNATAAFTAAHQSLTAAQALHAGTIQQQLTTEQPQSELDVPTAPEDPEGQTATSESVSETAEQEPEPPKRSFFKSFADFFRRKGE